MIEITSTQNKTVETPIPLVKTPGWAIYRWNSQADIKKIVPQLEHNIHSNQLK